MRVVVVTAPDPIVTWAEAQAHLRLDGDDERLLVEGMIAAATAHIDGPSGWLGCALGAQVLEARFNAFWANQCSLRLPYPPLLSLVGVTYLDAQGVERTADLEDFEIFGDRIRPEGSDWVWVGGSMREEAYRIQYRAGYEIVPAPIKAAVLLMVGDLFHSRATIAAGTSMQSVPMSTTVEALLQPYRVYC